MSEPTRKLIELEDRFVDHSYDYPYVLSCSSQLVLFSLRSNKTYDFYPILVMDKHKQPDLILPLKAGTSLDDPVITENCELLEGEFEDDGEWLCTFKPSSPGLVFYQLIFVRFGEKRISETAGFDAILFVQDKI